MSLRDLSITTSLLVLLTTGAQYMTWLGCLVGTSLLLLRSVNVGAFPVFIPKLGINKHRIRVSLIRSNSIFLALQGAAPDLGSVPTSAQRDGIGTAASRITTILSTCHLTRCLAGVSPPRSADILYGKKAIKSAVTGLANLPIFKAPSSSAQYIHISGKPRGGPHICYLLHRWASKH